MPATPTHPDPGAPNGDEVLSSRLRDYDRRVQQGEIVRSEGYRDRLGDAYGRFVSLLAMEGLQAAGRGAGSPAAAGDRPAPVLAQQFPGRGATRR